MKKVLGIWFPIIRLYFYHYIYMSNDMFYWFLIKFVELNKKRLYNIFTNKNKIDKQFYYNW